MNNFEYFFNKEISKIRINTLMDILSNLNTLCEKPIFPYTKINRQTRIYRYKNTYFKDMEELLTFLENKTFLANDISIIDYIGDFAQEIDVIQITNTTGIVILKREKLTTHKEFNEQYSRFQNKPIWEIKEEGIEDIITELKNQGQVFKQDEIDLENLRILSLLRHLPRK